MLEQGGSPISGASESYRVLDMCSADLKQVLTIENTAQVSPWSRLSFEESLTRQHACRVLIDSQDQIVAYHVACPIVDELHVLNVVVAKPAQGLGLSHMLMHDIMAIAERLNLQKIFLEVRASNIAAQSLYQKWQFKQIALRKEYYSPNPQLNNQREDALVFARVFSTATIF